MRKGFITFLLLISLFVFSGAAVASDVAITSVGQSPDGMMVKVLMKKLKIEPDYDAMMTPAALAGQKVLLAVVGGSSKGLGAAGIDKEQETARAVELINAAKGKDMKVVVMHVGGEGRRGALSDLFIEAVTGFGDHVIVVKSGNADGIFEKLKAASAQLVEVENIQATVTPLEAVFKEWGVAQ